MPLGAFRLNSLAKTVAAAPGGFEVINSLGSIDTQANDSFSHYTVGYVGDDSSDNPVFVHGYRDASDLEAKVVAFRVDQTTGAITAGTEATTSRTIKAQGFYIVTENQHAGKGSNTSNAGYFTYGDNTTADPYVVAFTVNTDTLAVTLGTEVQRTAGETAALTTAAYIDSNEVMISYRGSSNDFVSESLSRSGTTLTAQNSNQTAQTSGGIVHQASVGFSTASSQRRYVVAATGNNFDGSVYAAIKEVSGVDYSVVRNVSDIFDGTETNTTTWVVNLDSTSKFAIIRSDTNLNNIKAMAVDVNWQSGTTSPTVNEGTVITLTGTDYIPLGFSASTSNNEFYYFYENGSGNISYRVVSASGTTLTEGSENDTGISASTRAGTYIGCEAASASGNYHVAVIDNSGSSTPDVLAIKAA